MPYISKYIHVNFHPLELAKKTIIEDMLYLPDSTDETGSSMVVKPQMCTKSAHQEHFKYVLLVSQVCLRSSSLQLR